MKKKLTLTIALSLLIVTASVFAQTPTKFRFGISGNVGYGWIKPKVSAITTKDGKAALGYALMFDYNLSETIAISSGLDINYRGGSASFYFEKGLAVGSTKINLQYLEIPLQLKMKTKAIGYFTYFASFGGSLGYTLDRFGDYNLTETNSNINSSNKIIISDSSLKAYINPLSVSLLINIGTEYNISGKTSLYGSLFFNNSFLDIMTDPKISKEYLMNARANVLGVKLGVFF